jgi:pimeloyl-ACP methyl ester carboxylesterase
MTAFSNRIFRRDGLDLALHVQEGQGPLVFFQHGLCGDAGQPAAVFPAGVGARLAVLECRGHGESPAGAADDFASATFADDLAAAIEDASDAPCIVGGISMGAAIAMRLACLRPDLVSSLIIARPAWTTHAAPRNMAPNLIVGQILQQTPAPDEIGSFLASETGLMLAEQAPDNLASLSGFFTRQPRAVTAELLTRISRDGPGITEAQLAALSIPTLVIGHGEDVIHPLFHARQLSAAIPGARLSEIPPKAQGRSAYESAFRTALSQFIQEMLDDSSRTRLV